MRVFRFPSKLKRREQVLLRRPRQFKIATVVITSRDKETMPKAHRAHKHTRPSEPVTPEILKVILIKTSQLQETFRDFNEDDRNDRRSDIIAKFIADLVHGKFRENDK